MKDLSEPRTVGFWSEDLTPQDCQGRMTKEELTTCLDYIAQAKEKRRYKGWAACRICGERLGSCDMQTVDGRWIFPEDFDHYLTEHSVRPPDERFIRNALRRTKEHHEMR